MLYVTIKLIHIFSVFIYGGFLFTDNLFFDRMKKELGLKKYQAVRDTFMFHVRKIVPKSLIAIVLSGLYLLYQNFGVLGDNGLSNFQFLLLFKTFLGLWLGLRGILQVFFNIQPLVFKSHKFAFLLVIIIITLSQVMYHI